MIVGQTMWTQSTSSTSVADGRTDRITMTKTVQRVASRGKDNQQEAQLLLGDRATRKHATKDC